MLRPLYGLPKVQTIKAYDLEWKPGSYELRLICVSCENGNRYYTGHSNDDIVGKFCENEFQPENAGAWYYAHAGSLADIQFLIPTLANRGYRVQGYFSGSALILVDVYIGKHRFRLLDSYFLLKEKLKKVGDSVGLPKLEMDDFHAPLETLLPYCERDADIVRLAVTQAQNRINALGGPLRSTVASTAHALVHSRYLTENIPTKSTLNAYLEDAFFGGRVENYHKGELSKPLWWYDINSSYAHSMLQPIPGRFRRAQSRFPNDDRPYMAEITVDVPTRCQRPPLPVRLGPQRRLYFPTGVFTGVWARPEIEYALECGARILAIQKVLVFDACTFLHDFAREVYALRCEYPKGSAEYMTYKFVLNGGYGKYGQREQSTTLHLNPPFEPDASYTYQAPNVYIRKSEVPMPHRHLPIVCYITSLSRVNLARHMDRADSVYYCDTDGFVTDTPPERIPCDDALGGLKLEKTLVRAHFHAPKLYLTESVKGETEIKSKGFFGQDITNALDAGVPTVTLKNRALTESEYYDLLNGKKIRYTSMCRVRSLVKHMRDKPQPWDVIVDKGLTGNANPKRQFFQDGTSAPWSYETLMAVEGPCVRRSDESDSL